MPYEWYQSDLSVVLSGSAKEIYETGSQVVDLYLVMKTILSSGTGIRERYRCILQTLFEEELPDLTREMGLTMVESDLVEIMVEEPGRELQV